MVSALHFFSYKHQPVELNLPLMWLWGIASIAFAAWQWTFTTALVAAYSYVRKR
jgi:hypothetical protein